VDANIIFGTVIDDSLGDEVRITVIAAGFDGGLPARRTMDTVGGSRSGLFSAARSGEVSAAPAAPERPAPAPVATTPPLEREPVRSAPSPVGLHGRSSEGAERSRMSTKPEPQPVDDDPDDVDVPSFMRR
jgi:cell division protein FtsZ